MQKRNTRLQNVTDENMALKTSKKRTLLAIIPETFFLSVTHTKKQNKATASKLANLTLIGK